MATANIDKINALMRSIRFAMFTTEHEGKLRGRPMALVQPISDGGEVMFLSGRDAPKVGEVRDHAEVNVTFSDPHAGCFVSLSGTARVDDDRETIERLWSPIYQAWFPQGLEDPHLVMIRVLVHNAEFWDRTSNRMVALENMVRTAAAGKPIQPAANHEKIEMPAPSQPGHHEEPSPPRRTPLVMQPVDEETD